MIALEILAWLFAVAFTSACLAPFFGSDRVKD